MNEMLLVRLADNFTSYLSEIIRECLRARPEALRSKETITVELALQCGSVDELRTLLAERKVDELAYLGFPKLCEWVDERLGVPELLRLPARPMLIKMLELRNCVVHNRGRLSPRYARSALTEKGTIAVGGEVEIGVETLFLAARATAECVQMLDNLLREKFSLPLATADNA
jgi:hypothetical protein